MATKNPNSMMQPLMGQQQPSYPPSMGGQGEGVLMQNQGPPMPQGDQMQQQQMQQQQGQMPQQPMGPPMPPVKGFDPYAITPWDEVINQAAIETGMPHEYLKSIIQTESRFNPEAVSSAGAVGLMQMTPGAAEDVGANWEDVQNNPNANILAGAQYLAPLYQEFGPYGAWAAYNAGPSRFRNEFGGEIANIPQTPGYAETYQGLDRLQGYYPQGLQGGAPMQQTMQANPQQYRDPFDPNADLTLPGQPIYGQQNTGPQMGRDEPGRGMVGPGPQGPGQQGAGQPASPEQGGTAQPGSQAPQVQGYEAPPGSMNIPTPEHNPGFWETIRLAASNDPATFYMILADLASLNVQGIKQTLQQREQNLLARAELQAQYGSEERDEAQATIDKIRYRASVGGYLDAFEQQNESAVDTMEEARALEAYHSAEKSKENELDLDAKAQKQYTQIVRTIASNPETIIPEDSPALKRLFPDDAQRSQVYSQFEAVKGRVREDKESRKIEREQRQANAKERLEMARQAATTRESNEAYRRYSSVYNTESRLYEKHREEFDKAAMYYEMGMGDLVGITPEKLEDLRNLMDASRQRWEQALADMDSIADMDAGAPTVSSTGAGGTTLTEEENVGIAADLAGTFETIEEEEANRKKETK